jgi:hypothetical protein
MAKSKVDWAGHVLAWRGSGLSQAAYARLHGIRSGALSAQVCKAAGAAVLSGAPGPRIRFVEGRVQGAAGAACAAPGAVITLRHAGGWSIDWPVQLHASVLAWAGAL